MIYLIGGTLCLLSFKEHNMETVFDTMNGGSATSLYIIGAIFLILGIVFLCGKGANLVAGYNTLSKEEKEKYDEKILTRWIGYGFTPIGITIIVFGLFGMYIPSGFVSLIPIEAGITIVFAFIGSIRAKRK